MTVDIRIQDYDAQADRDPNFHINWGGGRFMNIGIQVGFHTETSIGELDALEIQQACKACLERFEAKPPTDDPDRKLIRKEVADDVHELLRLANEAASRGKSLIYDY